MRWVVVTLFLCLPAHAQPIQVSTGEHGSFTRVVLTIPPEASWTLGRYAAGYALDLKGLSPSYDLSRAYDRIARQRLSAIRAETEGRLLLEVACRCHALPFEFRSDMLVIDIRDGPPPIGSSFELGLDGAPFLPLSGTLENTIAEPPIAGATGLNWAGDWLVAQRIGKTKDGLTEHPPSVLDAESTELKTALLMEFSRAASDGLLDPVKSLPEAPTATHRGDPAMGNMRIGEGLTALPATDESQSLARDGSVCPAELEFAPETWGDGRPARFQLGDAARDLVGEFDTPDPAKVIDAVRLHLHFGLGEEAAELLTSFPTGHPDTARLLSLSRLVDGYADPSGPWPPLAACDGPAALWAALSDPPRLPKDLNRDAALRSFSSLTPDLRRNLGPTLAEVFLAADDIAAATSVVESVLRLPGKPDDRTEILSARLSLLTGGLSTAEARLQSVMADPGPDQAMALVALVDLHVLERRAIDADIVPELAAYKEESVGTAAESVMQRAYILALALAGEFDAAFAEELPSPDVAAELWRLLADGPDERLVLHAVGADPTQVEASARTRIAERLASLGFTAEAQRWSGSTAPLLLPAPPDDPVRTAILRRDWQELPAEAPSEWVAATDALRPGIDGGMPPLAGARALMEQSAETRSAINALLGSVKAP